jgi:hypothetical protein
VKIESRASWLFADSVANGESCELSYVEMMPYEKGGHLMLWLGHKGNFVGDFQCFPSAIKNLKELIAKYGSDDTTWKGKLFKVTALKDEKKMTFSPF